jgi:FkbM family methyltransferase
MFAHKPNRLTLDLGGDGLTYFFPRAPFDNSSPSIPWCLEHQMPEDGMFLDIGANLGSWTLPFAASGKCSHVVAWEPQRGTRECLLAGVAVNGLTDKVTVFKEALGNAGQDGIQSLHIFTPEGGASSLLKDVGPGGPAGPWPWTSEERVYVRTLDSYDLGLHNIGFIKLDVEGNELAVLQGAVETLKGSGLPPIFFEAWSWNWYAEQKAKLFAFIESLGYGVHPIIGSTDDFLAVRK